MNELNLMSGQRRKDLARELGPLDRKNERKERREMTEREGVKTPLLPSHPF